MKWAVWCHADQTITYLDGDNAWTTDHKEAVLFHTETKANSVLLQEKGDGVEEVPDEEEFRARPPTW